MEKKKVKQEQFAPTTISRNLDSERVANYLKIILTGIPTAMALLFGQWVLTWNNWLLTGLIFSIVIFLIVSYFYLWKKFVGY